MLVIGLTGGIASGKSTVAKMLENQGIPVIDADHYARVAVSPGQRAYEYIVDHFGNNILHGDGTIDRKKLGAIIFNDEQERKVLNEIVHPAVREKMNERKALYKKNGHEAVVLDIPLLFESKLQETVNKIMLVYVDEQIQLKRLMERDGSTKDEALSRIYSQISLKDKIAESDAVVDNNGSEAETEDQLNEILKRWEVRP